MTDAATLAEAGKSIFLASASLTEARKIKMTALQELRGRQKYFCRRLRNYAACIRAKIGDYGITPLVFNANAGVYRIKS